MSALMMSADLRRSDIAGTVFSVQFSVGGVPERFIGSADRTTILSHEHGARMRARGRALSRADLIHLRAWLNDKIEGDLVVRDEVIDAIAQARGEIATGKATARKVL